MAAEYYRFYQLSDDDPPVEENIVLLTGGEEEVSSYIPTIMKRSVLNRSGKTTDNELRLTFSVKSEFAKSRLINRQERRYWVEIAISPTDNPFWRGKMRTANPSQTHIDLVFTSLLGSLRQYGLPVHFQKTCRHALYDSLCNVPRETSKHAQAVTIDKINRLDNAIEIAATTGWDIAQARRGTLEQGERIYYIVDTFGNTIVLQHTIKLEKTAATLWRGCDKTAVTCKDVFDNFVNFGGCTTLPDGLLWGEDISKFGGST